jgi:hypothetical protein
MEEETRLFSDKNVKLAKSTTKFKRMSKKAKEAYSDSKICEAKTCGNCMHRTYVNDKTICPKLGVVLHDSDDLVCGKWGGALYTVPQPKFDDTVIAWAVINKDKFNY